MKPLLSNIVKRNKLKEVQSRTLNAIADVVMETAGPFGTNTILLHDNVYNEYSKDGHKVLKNIRFYDPLEHGIQTELVEFTQHIVNTVGDGTTSAVKLAALIFDELTAFEKAHSGLSPVEIVRAFKEIVSLVKDEISKVKKDLTIEDIYNICMISTNGDTNIAHDIHSIYKEFGLNVFINVCISNTTESFTKSYDGLTLERGYNSPAFINSTDGVCRLRNPKIYCFEDPIDTPEMMAFFSTIVIENCLDPKSAGSTVPTFVVAPSISRDAGQLLEEIENMLYTQQNLATKPPILIITGIAQDVDSYRDIARLCGAPMIKKYINPDIQQKDIEAGKAPDMTTILDWCGTADLVESDLVKTKFINPSCMFSDELDADGNKVYSSVYSSMIGFFEGELQHSIDNSEDITMIHSIRKRLNCLKANMVDYYIGGVTATDRDSVIDLVEDAVLNCRSASRNGVGCGANFEGFRALNTLYMNDFCKDDSVNVTNLIPFIYGAYRTFITELYMTSGCGEDKAALLVDQSLELGMPYNLKSQEFDGKVLASIDTDNVIMDTISKIITIMFTANQALLVSPLNNKYMELED